MDDTPKAPSTPRLGSTALPEVDDAQPPNSFTEINELTNISDLSNAQLHELNQNLLDSSTVDRPLINEIAPMSALREEYENGAPSFVQQIDWLFSQGYTSIRRTRGDGDCFYRSVAFSYVERLLHAPDLPLATVSAISSLESTLPLLEEAGFEKMVYEDFYDVLVGLLQNIIEPQDKGKALDVHSLLQAFQSPEISNSIVVYLRLLTSAQLRHDPDEYAPFLFHPELGEPMDVRPFCEAFVEAVGKEADHVQMIALSRALQININVAYLDGRGGPDGQVNFVEFRHAPDSGAEPLVLLYRPGHYDILQAPTGAKTQ
ncbi:cysteine proteinase [Mycena floridula]|nr:cysteine proteinase [Mycena floridula]